MGTERKEKVRNREIKKEEREGGRETERESGTVEGSYE